MTGVLRPPPGHELLDDPHADETAAGLSLRNIARSNRWFGGVSAVRFGLRHLLAGGTLPRTLTLLDIGTGLGDLPQALTPTAERAGHTLRAVGVDWLRVAARLATQAGIATAVASVHALPIRERSVDIVLLSQFLHHFPAGQASAILAEADRIARHGVIVADLRRDGIAVAGFWLGSRLLGFDPSTCADGVTSVRRGYSAAEFRALFLRAGVRATVHRRPPYRLVGVWRPSH
jgi:ubiquinone/menaquinone biosynthesis C-methylase UbiE